MPKQKTDRDTILRKSLDVFLQKGYYHTKFSDLGEACGMEKSHFYYYFRSKEDLMLAVLEFTCRNVKQHILEKAYDETYTPQQRLAKMMQNTVRLHASTSQGCLMGNTVLGTTGIEPKFQGILRRYFEGWVAALSHVFQAQYAEDKAQQLAQESIQEIQGSVMFVRLYNDPNYLEEAANRIVERLSQAQVQTLSD